MVLAAGMPGKTRGRIQIGAADPSLTGGRDDRGHRAVRQARLDRGAG